MIRKPVPSSEFWITNISKKDVNLSDLAVSIKAHSSINLLDKKHYSLTREQCEKSVNSGSIYVRRSYIKVREVLPYEPIKQNLQVANTIRSDRVLRPVIHVEQPEYEELSFSDEEIASDALDMFEDKKKIIK